MATARSPWRPARTRPKPTGRVMRAHTLVPRDPHGVPPVDRPDGPPSERLDGSGFARAPACYLRATVRTWRRSLGSGRVPAAPAAARRRAPRRHGDAPGGTPGEGRGARPPVAEDGRGGSGEPSRPSRAHRVRASRDFSSPGAAGGGGAPRGGRGGSGGGRRGIREERPVPGSGVHAESHVPSPGPLGSSGRGPDRGAAPWSRRACHPVPQGEPRLRGLKRPSLWGNVPSILGNVPDARTNVPELFWNIPQN